MLEMGQDRTYQYKCKDVFSQLRYLSERQYLVYKPVTISNIESAIEEMCIVTPFNNNPPSKVLPINICSDECNHGPQWVGLAIIHGENNTYKAFIVNALEKYQCETAFNFEFLKEVLTRNNINVYLYYKLSHIYYDSGPLTVMALDKFARTRSFLEIISDEDIIEVRQSLIKLQDEYSQLKRSTMNFNISKELIREIKETNLEKSKKLDIKIIMKTLKLLENIIEIKSTLRQIGDLFGGMTNDETNKDLIKNKYGCSKEFNNRIPFDHFYHLTNYFDNENKFKKISQDDLKILENHLPIVKRKLIDILKNERDFVDNKYFLDQIDSISEENKDDLKPLFFTIEKYLKLLISSDINEVIDSLNGFNLDNIHDRCKFARMLTKIGESANKLEKSLTNKQMINTKDFYAIRNKIIHGHKRIKFEPLNIDLIISVIRNIKHNSENDEIEILGKRKELLKDLEYRPHKAEEETTEKNNENIQYNLDVLIFKAAKICKGISNYSNREEGLEKLNKHYQSQLASLDEAVKKCYPEALHLNFENKICTHSKNNIPIPSQKKFHLEIEELNYKKNLRRNILNAKISDINDECNYLIKVINDKSMDSNKQQCIISHIIMIIMQYVREIATKDFYDNLNDFSDEIEVSLKEDFRKFLQNEFLADDNSIRYLYTSSNIQYCPIIALIFCNVGVSLAKLTLYEKSIDYLKKATEYITQFNHMIFSNNLTIDKNAVEIEFYQLSINRIYAKVLYLAKKFDDSFQEFDKINKKIQLEKNNEIWDINIKNELIQFYMDFSLLLIDQEKFTYANLICKEALKLDSNNSAIELRLLESYCKNENFFDTDLVDNSQDDGEKCNILNKIVILCLLYSNVENGVKKAEIYLTKMNNIICNKNGSFYDVYYQKFLQLKLKVLLVKSTIDQSIESIYFFQILELEMKNLIAEIKSKNHSIINWVYLSFCCIYSNYAKTTGEKKHIDEAKYYYDKLTIDNNQIYVATVIEFLEAYIGYSINKSNDIEVEILKEHLNFSIDLQKKFKIRSSLILQQIIRLIDIISDKYMNNDPKQYLLFIKKKYIFIKYMGDHSNLMLQYQKQMASCCSKLADSLFDIKIMKEAVFCYKNLLLHMLPVNEVMDYCNKKENYETQINKYKTLLDNILRSNFDFNVDPSYQRCINHFNEKFGLILEIENERLRFVNMDSIPAESLKAIHDEKKYFERPYSPS